MFHRLRSASLALLAMLAAASPCLAADGMGAGRAGIGGQIGGSTFWSDGDYSNGSLQRLAFSGHFRYQWSDHFRWQISPGFTWSGYTSQVPPPVADGNVPGEVTKAGNLTLLLPMSLQVQYLIHRGKWHSHLGLGPGLYRVWIEDHRQVLVDPTTFRSHRGIYTGVTAEFGIERFLKSLPSTSLEITTASHWVFAQRDEQFPSGYNSFLGATEFRIGGNYYFDTGRLKRETKQELPHTQKK
jgi:hypothetical protein